MKMYLSFVVHNEVNVNIVGSQGRELAGVNCDFNDDLCVMSALSE
jgi:hypothetical protein